MTQQKFQAEMRENDVTLKAVPSDILSSTAVSLQEMLCAGCQSLHGSQQLLLLNIFQNMSSLGNFSFQFRMAKCSGFFLSSLVAECWPMS